MWAATIRWAWDIIQFFVSDSWGPNPATTTLLPSKPRLRHSKHAFAPPRRGAPLFLSRKRREANDADRKQVNWTKEQACFESLAREFAELYCHRPVDGVYYNIYVIMTDML